MYDVKDERGVPVSSGIPPIVRVAALIGIIVVFTVLTLVFRNSSFGHSGPSNDSVSIPV
jgi:hypothetical protein